MGKDLRAVWQGIVLPCVLAIIVTLQFAAPAQTAKRNPVEDDMGPPMRFAVVRNASPGCEPLCPEWIAAEGTIVRATPAEFKKLLKKLGDKRLPVIVSSRGGQVEAAWELGRIFRARKLDIGVGLTRFVGCAPEQKECKLDPARKGVYAGYMYAAGSYCASACPMMFAGGVRRYAGQWAYMGVHQVTSYYTQQKVTYRETYRLVNGKKTTVSRKVVGRKNLGNFSTTKIGDAFRSKMLGYLKEMDVKEVMFEAGQSTLASEMRQLTTVEMLNMNLVTSLDAADVLVRTDICKGALPAANCIVEPGAKLSASSYPKALVPDVRAMWLAVVRSSESGCEPDCPEWISAEGPVDAEAARRLGTMLKALGDRKLPLVISSSGGDVSASMEMGRLIRKSGLDVAVGSTFFVDCKPRAKDCIGKGAGGAPYFGNATSGGGECAGSCLLILSGGKSRLAGDGVIVGWEKPDTDDTFDAYFEQMGVAAETLKGRPVAKLDNSTLSSLVQSKLLTRVGSVDLLVDGGICRMLPKPANCRLVYDTQRR